MNKPSRRTLKSSSVTRDDLKKIIKSKTKQRLTNRRNQILQKKRNQQPNIPSTKDNSNTPLYFEGEKNEDIEQELKRVFEQYYEQFTTEESQQLFSEIRGELIDEMVNLEKQILSEELEEKLIDQSDYENQFMQYYINQSEGNSMQSTSDDMEMGEDS